VKFVVNRATAGAGGNVNEKPAWTFSSDVCKHCVNAGCLGACPTGSIVRTKFGATLYDPRDSSVGGIHAMFIVRGDPKAYNLPPHPDVPTVFLRGSWTSAFAMAGAMLAGVWLAFAGNGEVNGANKR
jgi:hypothetical protein